MELPVALCRKLRLPKGSTFGDAIAFNQVLEAAQGSIKHAKEITDRIEGKAVQKIKLANDDDTPLSITVKLVKAAADKSGDSRS